MLLLVPAAWSNNWHRMRICRAGSPFQDPGLGRHTVRCSYSSIDGVTRL